MADHGPGCRCLYHASLGEANDMLREHAESAGEREEERRVEQGVVDLGGHDTSRYWRVTTGEHPDDPDARSAAVHARLLGCVGCTYNGVTVERYQTSESPLT